MIVRLHPSSAWRIGPDSGDRDRVDRIYHSDSLASAVASAMARLGNLAEWLDATVRAAIPAVHFSSCFPFCGDTLLVVPPRSVWPPPPSSKVRWKGARFVPVSMVEDLIKGRTISDEGWMVDGASECLVPHGAAGPFRVAVRSSAAVDRWGESISPHSTACIEFAPNAGLWTIARFASDAARAAWSEKLKGAFRLLGDSGFGGERSRGWGRAEVSFSDDVPALMKSRAESGQNVGESGWWMLSLFHPAPEDSIQWQRGNYALVTRGGRIESSAGWGHEKASTRMIAEGSVVVAAAQPRGSAANVAPEDFAHPVYRSGFALAIPVAVNLAKQSAPKPPTPADKDKQAAPVDKAPLIEKPEKAVDQPVAGIEKDAPIEKETAPVESEVVKEAASDKPEASTVKPAEAADEHAADQAATESPVEGQGLSIESAFWLDEFLAQQETLPAEGPSETSIEQPKPLEAENGESSANVTPTQAPETAPAPVTATPAEPTKASPPESAAPQRETPSAIKTPETNKAAEIDQPPAIDAGKKSEPSPDKESAKEPGEPGAASPDVSSVNPKEPAK